jgi:hypothetical protein
MQLSSRFELVEVIVYCLSRLANLDCDLRQVGCWIIGQDLQSLVERLSLRQFPFSVESIKRTCRYGRFHRIDKGRHVGIGSRLDIPNMLLGLPRFLESVKFFGCLDIYLSHSGSRIQFGHRRLPSKFPSILFDMPIGEDVAVGLAFMFNVCH